MAGYKQWIQSEIKDYWLPWLIITIVFFFSSLYIYENRGIFIHERESEHLVVNQQRNDMTLGELTGNMKLSQSFRVEENTFSRVQLQFGTYGRKNHGTLLFTLKEQKSGKMISRQKLSLSKLPDVKNFYIDFPPVHQAKGKGYIVSLEGHHLQSGNTVTLWRSAKDSYKNGSLTINGKKQPGDLFFKVLKVENKPLLSKTAFVLVGVALLLLFLGSVVLIRKCSDHLHKVFLIIAIPFGLIITLIIPPFDQFDEIEHYFRSFEVSEGKFTNQTVDQRLGNYIPISLVDTVQDVRFIHQDGFKYELVRQEFAKKLDSDHRIFTRNYASSYPPLIYFPQALGMMLGRLIFDSPLAMMYLGRLFNLIAYISIVYMALKIVPVKRKLFFTLALIPAPLILAASLSADGITDATALLFVAYILHLAYGKVNQINRKHIATAILIGLFIALSKIVYIPILFLFLIIPTSKFSSKKEYIKKFAYLFIGCMIPFVIWNLMNLKNMSVPDLRINPGVSPGDQVKFVLTHPLYYVKYFIDTLYSEGNTLVISMLGKATSNYLYQAPSIVIFSYLFMLLLFGIIKEETEISIPVRNIDRFIFLGIFSIVFLLIYTALYVGFSPVGAPIIGGVQGRYMIPIAALFFLSLSYPKIVSKDGKLGFLIYTIVQCSMFTLLLHYLVDINS
ncbi:DUF2142 domain-containing protein [Neobacillus sp. LXY-1]|uniref:DUF2142 domain-containing protein n=1 Tax=Neobacillus sp. LXY-1 TaxID=3379133 RepID=UPI003EE024C6